MDSVCHTLQWASTEASRCLFCLDAPCVKGCPTQIDIPHFIRLIRWRDVKGAKEVIKETNCFGGLCGYLCPTDQLCERDCIYSKIGFPIQIAALQAFACDHADYGLKIDSDKKIDRRVAIIGAGPAGISCAFTLKAFGYEVEIFEKEKFLMGTVASEIPEFKLPPSVLEKEMKELNPEQMKIHFGVEIDRDTLVNQIAPRFDSVFIAVGLNCLKNIELNKKNLKGVYEASMFLKSAKDRAFDRIKGVWLIIGGGDTALDCARVALRLGAKRSVVVYRRSKREMPGDQAEFEKATEEGVEFLWQLSPVRLIGTEKIREVELIRNVMVSSASEGRRNFKPLPGTKFKFKVDHVIFALGKERDYEMAFLLDNKKMTIHPDTLQIGKSKYFAGGDFVNGGKTVVQAIAEGKRAARSIDGYLRSL
jgi:NADPH-dependent glutamate synthase beta subunit-like oxidoreductase